MLRISLAAVLTAIPALGQTPTWLRIPTPTTPLCCNQTMTFDPIGDAVLLYQNTRSASQTWTWDGIAWQQVATTGPVDSSAVVVGDPARQTAWLLARRWSSNRPFETWRWTGTTWQQVQPTNNPPSFQGFAAT